MSRARNFADLAGSADAGGLTGRNLIINGAYQVYQRATSATAAASSYETADRWINFEATDGAYTTEQSTDHPLGSGYSHKAQVTTADTSIGAAQYSYIAQRIEAQNLQHLLYGTSSAKSLTLSFYVKSNKTGTYCITIYKTDSTAYLFTKEYTISSANTWEKKEITISPTAGSTSLITASAGAIANDNGLGIEVGFHLALGSNFTGGTSDSWSAGSNNHYGTTNQVNWMDSTSNNFYLTEVQLELGEKATPFEHRSFGDVLKQCERYYEKTYPYATVPGTAHSYDSIMPIRINGLNNSASEQKYFVTRLRTEKRASPTTTYYNEAGNSGRCTTYDGAGSADNGINIGLSISGTAMQGFGPSNGTFSGISCFMEHDAEL